MASMLIFQASKDEKEGSSDHTTIIMLARRIEP
jgi:hypothetical protein